MSDPGALGPHLVVTVEQLARLKDALGKHGLTREAVLFDGQYVVLSVSVDDLDRLIDLLERPG